MRALNTPMTIAVVTVLTSHNLLLRPNRSSVNLEDSLELMRLCRLFILNNWAIGPIFHGTKSILLVQVDRLINSHSFATTNRNTLFFEDEFSLFIESLDG